MLEPKAFWRRAEGVRSAPIGVRQGERRSTNWHLLVVVPSQLRAEWLLRQIHALNLDDRSSVVTLADLAAGGPQTVVQQVPAPRGGGETAPRALAP